MPADGGQGKRTVDGHRPVQHRAKHREHLQECGAHIHNGDPHGQKFSGDGENLRAGQEVLRCPEVGEQPRQGCPQGAADHPDGGRHHGHLRKQFPKDDARRELHGGGTLSHRLRLHQTAGREQRRADGAEERGEHHHALHDGQGAHGCGGTLLLQDEALPQPRELLHQQEHQRELPAGEEEKRPRPCDGALRQCQRKILVAYGLREPSPDTAVALRRDDAAVRGHGGRGERHRRTGRTLLRGLPGMAVAGACRTDRCVPDAPSVCHRAVHHVLPHGGAGHAQRSALADCAGHGPDAGGGDTGHERVPGAEGQAGIRGDEAQPRDGLLSVERGVRQAAGGTGLVARRPCHHDGDVHRAEHVPNEKGRARFLPRVAGTAVSGRCPRDRHAEDVLPRGAVDTGADSLRHLGVGRFPEHADAVDMPLCAGVSVAARVGHVQHHTGQDTGADATERHRADAGRPELLAGFKRRGVYRVHDHRHHRLLHHPHRVGLDYPGRRHGQLRAQREPDGWQGWRIRR